MKIKSKHTVTNKSKISTAIAELRKVGVLVYNFQSNRKMMGNCKGFPDFVVIYNSSIYFLEMKLNSTKDSLKEEQKIFQEAIDTVTDFNMNMSYAIINETNYIEIINLILKQKTFYKTV